MNYIFEYPKSALFYIAVVLITTSLSMILEKQKNRRNSVFILLVIILILTLVSGFRGISVGIDTANNYKHIYRYQTIESYNRYPMEPGLGIISIFSSYIFKDPHMTFLVIALIINSLIIYRLWSYRHHLSLTVSIFIYSSIYFFMTMNTLRQWLAVAILFYASKFLHEKEYFKYMTSIFIAMLFHNTAIISLGILIIEIIFSDYKYRNRILSIMSIFVSFFVIFMEYQFQLISQYAGYILNLEISDGSGVTFYIKLITLLLIYYILKKENFRLDIDDVFFKRFFRIYFAGLLISIPGFYISYLSRIALYYTVHEIIIIGILGRHIKLKKAKVLLFIVVSFSVLLFFLELMHSGRGHIPYIPYWK